MDTKLKKFERSVITKITAIIIAIISFAILAYNAIGFAACCSAVGYQNYVSGKDYSYAECTAVKDQFHTDEMHANLLAEKSVKGEKKMFAESKEAILAKAMKAYKDNIRIFEDGTGFDEIYSNFQNISTPGLDDAYSFDFDIEEIDADKTEKQVRADFEKQYDEQVDSAIESIGYNQEHYSDDLERTINLKYYVVTPEGQVISNLERKPSDMQLKNSILASHARLENGGEYYVFLPDGKFQPGDDYAAFLKLYDIATANDNRGNHQLLAIVGSSLVFALAIIWLILSAGHVKSEGEGTDTVLLRIDRIPSELRLFNSIALFCIPWTLLSLYAASRVIDGGIYPELCLHYDMYMGLAVAGSVFMALAVIYWATSLSRIIKKRDYSYIRSFLSVSLFIWCIKLAVRFCSWVFNLCRKIFIKLFKKPYEKIQDAMKYTPEHFNDNVMKMIIIVIAVNAILSLFSAFGTVILIGFDVWVATKVINYMRDLDAVIKASGEIEEVHFPSGEPDDSLKELAHNLSTSNARLNEAIEKAVKDEHLKTELITNVSHDLKTPLTSVINYTDLLSKCDIEDEDAKKYIDTLQTQSTKLKRLIEDLIEASKVSSGNVTLNFGVLSLSELVAQTIAEFNPELEKNGNSIILNDHSHPVIYADGPKTYRILSNLFSNVKKYAAPDTRVYVDIYSEDDPAPGYSYVSIKNVSLAQLNITPEELSERFVRGDKSRGEREGNGLGLSIAKDLCELQHGALSLEIDGDLFKATVKLPQTEPANR